MRKILIVTTALLLLLASLAGCKAAPAKTEPAVSEATAAQQAPVAEPAAEPAVEPAQAGVSLTDMAGRAIALDAPATRIVALDAASCEILCAIGAGETLIGRGEYCDYPPEVLEIPAVQSGNETNIEQILALAPEALLMSKMSQTEEQVAALENAGVCVVVTDASDIEGTKVSIRLIGGLTGRETEAENVIAAMQQTFDEVAASVAPGEQKTIYFEVSPLEYGLWTAGDGTFMNEIAELLGLKNAFADVSGWAAISEEQVIQRDPDYIVTISMYFGEGPTPVEEILSRAGWASVTAVQNGAVLNLTDNALSRPGPRLADGARQLHDFISDVEQADDAA